MSVIRHDHKDIEHLESIILQNDGTPLRGEIDMYRRIIADCDRSKYTWHFWHDLRLNISVSRQSEIQIDFLLVCEKGAVVVEVKGGKIGIAECVYYYEHNRERTFMTRSPFEQARDYKQALMDNRIINASQLCVDTVCAFPHTSMEHTCSNPQSDLGYKLWSRIDHENATASFAEFCINVLEEDRDRLSKKFKDLSPEEVVIAINSLLYSFDDRSRNPYNEHSIASIIERLKIDNLSVFNSLQKNERLYIEGGPGTGKTTIAKAYIDKYHTLRGLYLCWNVLLEAKFRHDIYSNGFVNCEIHRYASYILSLARKYNEPDITLETISTGEATQTIERLIEKSRTEKDFIPFDYIIIDEAQDILDKGAISILNGYSSITSSGLSDGRYLVFYDIEQGYKSECRRIDEIADSLYHNGAHFILDKNKRVPTNKEIVSFANLLLENHTVDEVLKEIENANYDSVRIQYFDGAKSLVKYLSSIRNDIIFNHLSWDDYVVLAGSSTKFISTGADESLYDRIATKDGIKELTPTNICVDTLELPFTSVLSYKGLECKHVIIVINSRTEINKLELYVGMTRAIVDVQILVLN